MLFFLIYYKKDYVANTLLLRGVLHIYSPENAWKVNGTGIYRTTMMTLPAAYRPSSDAPIPTYTQQTLVGFPDGDAVFLEPEERGRHADPEQTD